MATEVTQFSKFVFLARGPLPAEPTLREKAMEIFAGKLADPADDVNRLHGGWTRIHTVRVFGGPDEFQFEYGLLNPSMFQKKVVPPTHPAKVDRTAEIEAAKAMKAKLKADFEADKAKKLAEKKKLEEQHRAQKKSPVVVAHKAATPAPDKPPKPKRQKKIKNSRPPSPATR
jgi:hypothetical protein